MQLEVSEQAARAQAFTPNEGAASAISHHGEILQGVFSSANGALVRGLVTLPRHGLSARARFSPDYSGHLQVYPSWKLKALEAAKSTLKELNAHGWGGTLRLTDHIPPGYGLGSSTSDVVAAIRAVADAFGVRLRPATISRLAVDAEQASDPIMFEERVVLFAQRHGCVLDELGVSLPEMEVVGFNTDPGGVGVSTLEHPLPNYAADEEQMFRLLLGLLRAAVCHGRVDYLGLVASASARVNQRYLPKPHFDVLDRMPERVGAVGLQVAHSGTIAGLLFDPRNPELETQTVEAARLLTELGIHNTWHFRAGGNGLLP
jgi:uncharacterized protein involved in propanediol utilization